MLRLRILTACVLLFLCSAGAAEAGRTIRVYHVGNSVTDTIRYDALKKMAEARGHTHVFGRHMIPGAPLAWIYKHPAQGFKSDAFGYYPEALPNFAWDAVTLQPFDRHLTGEEGDVATASNYIELALKHPKNAGTKFYVYSRWPRREGKEKGPYTLDYAAKWGRKYTGAWDGTNEGREYFEKLALALREKHPALKERILLVPVGDVLLELDARMKAGKVPGYGGVADFYFDGIHFNNVGAFVVGTTFFATLYGEDPKGLPFNAYDVRKEPWDRAIDPALAAAVQEVVWSVVGRHPLSGVKAREP